MSKTQEALKLALEALEEINRRSVSREHAQLISENAITALREALAEQPAQIAGFDVVLDESMPPNTMKFVQPAQQEQDRQIDQLIQERDHRDEIIDKLCDAVLGPDRYEWSSQYFFEDAVREVEERMAALEQPTRESAYQRGYMDGIAKGLRMEQPAQQQLDHTAAANAALRDAQNRSYQIARIAQQQEPVACQHKRYSVDVQEQTGYCIDCGAEGRMRFVVGDTPPASKPWVGLTDQEIEDLWNQHEPRFDYYYFFCDIEAKLKEKNG